MDSPFFVFSLLCLAWVFPVAGAFWLGRNVDISISRRKRRRHEDV